ncbi:pyrimidine-nucleoside phosphorylase [Thermanaerovibrio acidaminovorans DSM 6589]|jgi:pyrimidine-nucleoside phosphorylase|uniref:Pyrimidine-nucleoside phosphorylase n=1 Tax=Thermanaerovibrio acidaminovorans (strain ATCC 49978 / DSM 6589 / Su883) TaxID=525903 RepID=D1B5G2_THEAS|nr:thymidine phosphorylase [Thermanaerovibrio acidaminovorans]ACZ19253.1 pyrimidine-nucleoside phosphorylase [Thermanaerovibrio acidaminovorans DSM 6589]
MRFNVLNFIEVKRDGGEHSEGEMRAFVQGLMDGSVADYQAAAWLMAAFIRGLSIREMSHLTVALARSGDVFQLDPSCGFSVDKHSTGGVGDKVTLVLVPLVASLGIPVAKLSGRGLGFTGGTVDKLEAIPGMNVHLTMEAFKAQVAEIGCAVSGHSLQLAPAEGKLYHLRDVTSTVPSMGLIATSIVSKKIAGGANGFVFDVKWGRGALMESYQDAVALGRLLVDLSWELGHPSRAVLTSMEQPLGQWVGNSAEVREAIEVLSGGGPESTRQVCLALAREMVLLANKAQDPEEAMDLCRRGLDDGSALERFAQMVSRQGGDSSIVDPSRWDELLPLAPHVVPLVAQRSGYVSAMDTRAIGEALRSLGGGRMRKEDPIDHRVSIRMACEIGQEVQAGDPLLHVYGRTLGSSQDVVEMLRGAVSIGDEPVEPGPLMRDVIAPLERTGEN